MRDAIGLTMMMAAAALAAAVLAFSVPAASRPLILLWHGNGQRCSACH